MSSFAFDYLILNIVLFIAGLLFLIKGSDLFVEAASQIARNYKIPEIVIGLTLVSIGTSLPEFATDVYASVKGSAGIVVGDLVGSNITNIALVLGIAVMMLGTMPSPKAVVKRDALFMLGVFFVFAGISFMGKGNFGRIGGFVMLVLMVGYLFYLFKNRDALEELEEGEEHNEDVFSSLGKAWLFLFLGIILIFFWSQGNGR